MASDVQVGRHVFIRPTEISSDEFRGKVKRVGLDCRRTAVVLYRYNSGVCTLLLPLNVSVPGHSHPFPDDSQYAGLEYLDVSEVHLSVA